MASRPCPPTSAELVLFAFLSIVAILELTLAKESNSCYDQTGKPKKCLPEFVNAAFNLPVEATNTCGEDGPTEFCTQTGATQSRSCDVCYSGDHPPSHLTDVNSKGNETWWQSGTMSDDLQYPNMVNLTLHLGKAHDITYIRLLFRSPRPDSFAIYKRTSENGSWVPYQFYSADCRTIYGREDSGTAPSTDVTAPLCTSEFSDISPLTGGTIVFSTLEGRIAGWTNFDHIPALHEWVSATAIRVTLNRMNTFGDEFYGGENVYRSYFYAINEIAIGARCTCNGHAARCNYINTETGPRKTCFCEHNTEGNECERCKEGFKDRQWKRATDSDPAVCQACNCNGYSTRCFFDEKLYEKTGHGGHCLDCSDNRDGPNCERCRDNYYMKLDGVCLPCYCNDIGSRSLQCNTEGKCDCKPGVIGDKCDQCAPDFYDFSSTGCKECNCTKAGSYNNEPNCDQTLGLCQCKENVEGKECSKCKPGFFNLAEENEFGCTPCFCYGHATVCQSATGYSKVWIESMFARNNEKWMIGPRDRIAGPADYNSQEQAISVTAEGRDPIYFVAPERFLGEQRASYNQELQFRLKVGEQGPAASIYDVILEGNKLYVSQTIFGQGNPLPSTTEQLYKFKLHEHPDYGWEPRLSARDFISILSNLTGIRIKGTYSVRGKANLDQVKLGTAIRGAAGQMAGWIEWCQCGPAYIGQFCESCAPGYRHDPPGGDSFSQCIPCNCNHHADICDPDTGRCICQHNTAGDQCERCARGYYGNALSGAETDCQPCPCPDQGACYQLPDASGTIICLECPKGYAGAKCDQCSDGYYGELGVDGKRMCRPCDCNGNVDPNAVNNCNRITGECLKCIYNTASFHCDQCLPGYYGDPLAPEKDDCKPCQCDRRGTEGGADGGPLLCNQDTGQCQCKPNVTGTNCDQCKAGYYNLDSGKGCQPCNCNLTGSLDYSCDLITGACLCKNGVAGEQCDHCERYHYGFSTEGCLPCDCDQIGSHDLQCNATGHCPCLENVEGRHCDRCKENKYDRKRNCVDCPACYSLVQDEVKKHRSNLAKLDAVLQNIIASPAILNDDEFETKVKDVKARVEQLWADAKRAAGDDAELARQLKELSAELKKMDEVLSKIESEANQAEDIIKASNNNASAVNTAIEEARKALKDAELYLDTEGSFALRQAHKRSAEFGQQNKQMTDIAHEARTIVERQLVEGRETQKAAEKAVQTCEEAYRLSFDVKQKQANATRDLQDLESKIGQADGNVKGMIVLSSATLEKVNKAYQDVTNFAVDITNLADPKVDPTKIKYDASDQIAEAKRLQGEAEKLENVFRKEEEGVNESLRLSEKALNDSVALQQDADLLLAEADQAKTIAMNAVNLGEKTLQDAKETLSILQHFDSQIQEGKQRAEMALNTIPQIEQMLTEAKEKTTNAQEALAGAENNAAQASQTAQAAQSVFAQQASQLAKDIREKAEKAKKDASDLSDSADTLSGRVTETGLKIDEMKTRVDNFVNFTNQAKEKVGQAKTNADQATEQVKTALENLNTIIKELNDLSDIDEDTLNQLEAKLQQAETEFRDANLDEQINALTAARVAQDQRMKSYEEEVARLEGDVEKVRKIKEALPDGCFGRSLLEL